MRFSTLTRTRSRAPSARSLPSAVNAETLGASAQTHASPSTTTRAGKANEWRGPRYAQRGQGRWPRRRRRWQGRWPRRCLRRRRLRQAPEARVHRGRATAHRRVAGARRRGRRARRHPRQGQSQPLSRRQSHRPRRSRRRHRQRQSDAPPRTGDPIIVADHEGKALAWGVYNDTSQYVVRILRMAWECGAGAHLGRR